MPASVIDVPARCGRRRLVSLLLLLQMRGQLTAQELASHFEVSVRTIHRDVESLVAAGVPVEAVRGPAGGYRLAGGYRTKLTGLTAEEAESALRRARAGRGARPRRRPRQCAPEGARGPPGRAAGARRPAPSGTSTLTLRRWCRAEDTVPHLPAIASATWQERRLSARYREGSRIVRLDPRSARSRAQGRGVVSRRASLGRDACVPRLAVRRGACTRRRLRAARGLRPRHLLAGVVAHVRGVASAGVGDAPCERARAAPVPPRSATRRRRLHGRVREPRGCVSRAVKFGPDAEVLEPAGLRERLASTAQEVAALYGVREVRSGSRTGRPPEQAGAEAMEPQDSRSPGLFFCGPDRKERHVGGRDEALPRERRGRLRPTHARRLEWARETTAKMVDLKFCDLLGTWQHVTLPICRVRRVRVRRRASASTAPRSAAGRASRSPTCC